MSVNKGKGKVYGINRVLVKKIKMDATPSGTTSSTKSLMWQK